MPYNLTTMQSIYHGQDEIVEITYNGSSVYQKSSGPDYTEPFYVEKITNENEKLNIVKSADDAPTLTIEYSTDKTTWQTLGTTSTTALTITLEPGNKVYLRCSTNSWATSSARNTITSVSKVGGNVMSLLYGDQFADKTSFPSESAYNLSSLFYNNARLIDASNLLLPATTLTNYCYRFMFYNCTSLTSAPTLPATKLANYCYDGMFQGCTSLTSAPELSATTLVTSCYSNMFRGCTSLTTAPTTLPATTLTNYCYSNMFRDCTTLNYVKCLATNISATNATKNWLSSVSATGTFTKAAGVTWSSGNSGIPSGWTVVEV